MGKSSKIATVITCSVAAVVTYMTDNSALFDYKLRTRPVFIEKVLGKWEGCHQTPYADTGGLMTNGVGHLCVKGDGSNHTLTIEQVAKLLNKDLWIAEQCVNRYFDGHNLPQEKFEAVVDFSFNLGCAKARGVAEMTTLRRYALSGNYNAMCNELPKWSKGRNLKGQLVTIKGLYNRRKDVEKWCLTGNL